MKCMRTELAAEVFEYEKGKGYVYPGLLPDVPSDKTNWPK